MENKYAMDDTSAIYFTEGPEIISDLEKKASETSGQARIDVLNELSRLSWKLGNLDRSSELAEEAMQCARENDYFIGIAYSLSNLSDCHRLRGNIDQALAYAKESLEIATQMRSNHHVAYALNDMADIFRVKGDLSLALDHYQKALGIREQVGDIPGQTRSLNTLSEVFVELGDFSNSEKHCRNALTISIDHSYAVGIGYSKNTLADLFLLQGKLDEAVSLYKEALELRKELGDRIGEARSLNNLAQAFLLKGNLEQALKLSQESLKISKQIGHIFSQAHGHQNIGDIFRARGDKQALRSYEKSYHLQDELGHQSGLSPIDCAISEVYRTRGDFKKARIHAERGLKLAKRTGNQRFIVQALDQLALTYFFEGEISTARSLLDECITISSSIGDQFCLATFQTHLGEVLSALGDLKSAHQLFNEALSALSSTGYVKEIARIFCVLGNLLGIQGDYEKSMADLQKAIEMQTKYGFELDAAQSMNVLAKIQRNSGFLEEAYELFSQAELICRRLDDDRGLLVALRGRGRVLSTRGETAEAFSLYKKAFRIVGSWKEQFACRTAEGELNLLVGEVSKARKAFEQARSLSKKVGSVLDTILADLRLAEINLICGAPGVEILTQIDQAIIFLRESSLKGPLLFSGLLVRLHAIQEQSDNVDLELEIIDEMRQLAGMHQSNLELGFVEQEYGDIHLRRSNFGIARNAYSQAFQLAKNAHSVPLEFTVRLRLAELSVRDYGLTLDEEDYQTAYSALISVSKASSEKNIIPLFIHSLILRSLLASSAMQYSLALSLARKALKLSESHNLKQQGNRAKKLVKRLKILRSRVARQAAEAPLSSEVEFDEFAEYLDDVIQLMKTNKTLQEELAEKLAL